MGIPQLLFLAVLVLALDLADRLVLERIVLCLLVLGLCLLA
jgi:hypothetical protein